MNTELTDEERRALAEDISAIHMSVINQLIAVADKHNVDRDEIIKLSVKIFSAFLRNSGKENV